MLRRHKPLTRPGVLYLVWFNNFDWLLLGLLALNLAARFYALLIHRMNPYGTWHTIFTSSLTLSQMEYKQLPFTGCHIAFHGFSGEEAQHMKEIGTDSGE